MRKDTRKGAQKKKLADKSCESNNIFEEHVSSDIKHIHILILLMMKNDISSIFSEQTLQQIKVIQVVLSPEVSKLNHSLMNKKLVTCHPIISLRLMHRVIK